MEFGGELRQDPTTLNGSWWENGGEVNCLVFVISSWGIYCGSEGDGARPPEWGPREGMAINATKNVWAFPPA